MQRMTRSFTRSMNNTPFIYFSGDSFMHGDELADDTLQCWKDMFGTYQAVPDARYYTEFHEVKMKEIDGWSDSHLDQFICCQRDRHWSTLVCDKHRITYHNDGAGGSSQESVLHRAVISFDKFEQNGNVPTLAIIQLTNPGRLTTYNNMAYSRTRQLFRNAFDHTHIIKTVLNNINNASKLSRSYVLAHMDVESEMGNIVRWLTTLAITNSFFKEKTGKYPIYLVNGNLALNNYMQKTENIAVPEFQNLIHQARLYAIDNNVWNLGRDAHLTCPGGHHTPQTHANFAQFIAPHLLQELNRKEI